MRARTLRLAPLMILGSALLAAVAVQAVNPVGAPADHFLSYKSKKSKGSAKFVAVRNVTLVDDFESLTADATAVGDLLVPIGVNGGAPADAATHLRAYKIKGVKGSAKHVKQLRVSIVNDLSGTLVVDTVKPDLLLVPTATNAGISPPAPDPATHNVDHYECYSVRISKGAAKLPKGLRRTVVDPFTAAARVLEVKALKHLCLPVDKNGEGIKNPEGELTCYAVKAAKGQPQHVPQHALQVNNQFGPLTLDTVKENELCVPSVGPSPTPTPTTGGPPGPTHTPTPSSAAGGAPTPFPTGPIPPDPSLVAPPVARGVVNVLASSTSFLYAGANPLQTGVLPDTIEPKRAAVIRGRVLTANADPLPGVTIRIWEHPELGQTISRLDGMFDLVVNGGGPLTVQYDKAGVIPAQRRLDVPWQDFVMAPDVMLIAVDSAVTNVVFGAGSPFQTAESSTQTDADGVRHALVLFPAGTTADLVMPDGTTQPASALHVRATEFTVGDGGALAMPAGLPPLTDYTYCVELSADEAMAAGAVSVRFNQPVITYNENFLDFPIGIPVPVGTYDLQKAAWVPLPNGRIVKIVSITGGLADVDTDGDGVADNGLGITSQERQSLASIYGNGTSLWRVAVTHFSSQDRNNSSTPPADAKPPGQNGAGPDPNQPIEQPRCSSGSIIECENQVLGESVRIVGTPFTLDYRSDRVPGQAAARTIRLSGASVPPSLASIGLHLSVAGRSFDQTFAASPNQETTFVWDRQDAYGRQVVGGQQLDVTIDYEYPAVYQEPGPFPDAFNQTGGTVMVGNPTRRSLNLSDHFTSSIGDGLTDARTIGLGGWTLNVHHVYDPVSRVLHGGNGSRRRAGSLARLLTTIDVTGQSVLFDVAVGPDGSQYIALPHGDLIVRVSPAGTQTIVAGNGTEGFSGDGGPATAAELGDPTGIAVGADGSLYIAEEANRRIRKVSPSGTITTLAGSGANGSGGDGGPATQAALTTAERIAVGTDSSLYVVDGGTRIRRVTPDGIIQTVAGNGTIGSSGDGGPATAAQLNCASVAAAADGGFLIADYNNHRVRRVGPDGIIRTVADFSAGSGLPVSVNMAADGNVLIAVQFSGAKTPVVDLLKTDGTLFPIAGGGSSPLVEGIPATQVNLSAILAVAAAPDGGAYLVRGGSDSHIVRIGAALPGFEGNQYFIASADGAEVYVFDADGRHLQTVDALTGAVVLEFGYDADGSLATVTRKTGGTDDVTTIEHDNNGNPKAIVGPYGQRTELAVDANGFLTSIDNPAGETVQLTSSPTGLLQTYTDPRGKVNTFTFDPMGHLELDSEPAGASQTLVRTSGEKDFTVTRTTTLARTTTYKVEQLGGGVQRRTTTHPDTTQHQSDENIDAGKTHVISSDGTSSDTVLGPDPRFGMQAPITASHVLHLPSALTLTTSGQKTVSASPGNPLSVASQTTTATIDGRTTTTTYNGVSRVSTATYQSGRTSTVTTDLLGRLVQSQVGDLTATTLGYDNRGRISSLTRGSGPGARSYTLSYDAAGFLATVTDPLSRTIQLTRDAAGRTISKTQADGSVVGYGYDAGGNPTSITPPGRPAHTLAYSDRSELVSITPPSVPGTGAITYTYDADKNLTTIARPDTLTATIGYDSAGRPHTRTLASGGVPTGTDTTTYDATGHVASIAAAGGVTSTYAYDGLLRTGETFSGAVSGSVTRTFDTGLRPATESVDGANTVAFSYDADSLLVGVGTLAITRDAQSGLLTGTTLGVVSSSVGYNGFGEATSYTVTASGNPVYQATFSRDALGRIVQKVETIGGVTATYAYSFDLAGQLTDVTKNGNAVESYDYDVNHNRTNAFVNGVSSGATYDDQDRLTQYGATTFAYDAAGTLVSKTKAGQTTDYEYDQVGNLLGVTLPGGPAITYVVDGLGRRVAKKVDGVLAKGFLYGDNLRPLAELDANGALTSRFVYTGRGVPSYMTKAGATYRIVTDRVGSVRLVIDTTSGAVAQRLDYDSFGNVLQDTSPGFQPFGFAGGLYDPDTGLVRFGVRDYAADIGRWTAKDPLGFASLDTNLYRYAGNDPVNGVDPTGLTPLDSFLGGILDNVSIGYIAGLSNLVIPIGGPSLVLIGAVALGLHPGVALGTDLFGMQVDTGSGAFIVGNICGAAIQAVAGAGVGGLLAGGEEAGVAGVEAAVSSVPRGAPAVIDPAFEGATEVIRPGLTVIPYSDTAPVIAEVRAPVEAALDALPKLVQ